MRGNGIQEELALAAADAAQQVPGVAFLRPGLADLLRASAGSRAGRLRTRSITATARAGHGSRPPGVHVSPTAGPARWHIDIQLVARTAYRSVEVTRAVREAVEAVATGVLPEPDHPVRITVTVTGIV
ncbi:Asp23/Gls24 family envelope stress response protein [Streptomyces sp. NPDC126933]|uniref:Asp23/Gls24 family envelope stress response protein n=1 Tax=unclassified Streptomyces TaxID=2593676 RepID=UPI003656C495